MSRTLENAKAVVEKAIEWGAWSWEIPEDQITDQVIQETADMVVSGSLQAEAKGSVNEAVLEILFADSIEPTSAPTREAYARRFNVTLGEPASNGHAEQPAAVSDQASHDAPGSPAQASAFGQPQPSAGEVAGAVPTVKQADQPAASDDISDVFPDYDDYKAADIKKAILFSCADGSMSPAEWERIKAYEVAHEDRKTIRELQPEFKAPEPEPQPVLPTASQAGVTQATGGGAPADDVSLEQVYVGQVQTRAQQEGLPLPQQVEMSQAPVVPINIVELSDKDLSSLGAQLHSYFAYGQWLLSQEENRAAAAEHLEREAERDAFVRSYELHKEEIPEEKRSQPTALEAARKQAEHDAKGNPSVATWRSRKVSHEISAREIKALVNGWDKGVWRVDKELDRRARLATTGRAAQ
jgi:hypothetical protein